MVRGVSGPSSAQNVPSVATIRLLVLCTFFSLGSFLWGYNIGIMGTLYVHPGWMEALHHPTPAQKGLITAIYYVGTWTSYVFLSHFLSDKIGRRFACLVGTLTICVGSALQASARGPNALAHMICGRIICGAGIGVVSTAVPMYQSEISPARDRGRYVVINHIGLIVGIATAFWIGFGFSHWDSDKGTYLGWRFSICAEYIAGVTFMLGLPLCPETPRWLVEHGHISRARQSLEYLRASTAESALVKEELCQIVGNVTEHRVSERSWKDLFMHRDMFERLWRAALLMFMSMMSGATAMKYYLPTNFMALGMDRQLALMAGGIESTLKIAWVIVDMFLIDRFGRRPALISGSFVMIIALLINAALPQAFPNHSNPAADVVCIVFIFVFTFGYSIGFGPATWVYAAEIFPTNLRARGLNFAASGSAIGSIIVAQIWPVGFATIGSNTYYIFMVINIISVIIIYIFYPETKNRPLEDMDRLFKRSHSGDSELDVRGEQADDAEAEPLLDNEDSDEPREREE
ncbi:general substrate transporter [Lineolata rhizophorae]|uniref:General substrate transporter n=1 Tax=Lineolata rhizophorae TaxID=578093 RepID=A0A6A6NN05_9PEZI|nr:general substrate transporter [Lineolata rhizophorae]